LKGVFVANKRALLERKEVLDVAHELLERFEAHLTAHGQFTVLSFTTELLFSFFTCVDGV
jgi:ATP phosphoribosyltransferase